MDQDINNKERFLETIRSCRRRLNAADLIGKAMVALAIGAGAGCLFQIGALVTPFYRAGLYTALAILSALAAALVAAFLGRKTMEETALIMDGFGFEERIVTAYGNLSGEGMPTGTPSGMQTLPGAQMPSGTQTLPGMPASARTMIEMQREDAMRELAAHKDRIRIPFWPPLKRILAVSAICLILLGLILTPSAAKDRARELHDIREEAKEKEQEIEEVVETLEELAQEELTPEQQAALQEMIESLQSSMAEYEQTDTVEGLSTAGEKLDYKYQDMSSQLSALAEMMQSGAAASEASAASMQAMADKLREMSGMESPGGELASNPNAGPNAGQNGQSGQNADPNGSEEQGGKDGQGGGENPGTGDGQGGSQSQGDPGDQGSGGESGDGQGGQAGGEHGQGGLSDQGSGGDPGDGRGTGSGSAPHDYVSIPNEIADSGNLTGIAGNHDDSEFFRAQGGLSWEGTHMSPEAVIGSYERNAYEGIAAGRYPGGMEDVIKEYFSGFN
ncbi:MAG: hypothetical protein NC079_04610 [Clostridium sp.]|nr:hypothetical protein [Acetatifactor muris]MCM1562873.1 hypothetical protein [Clostridium sp.]